jgi:tetratricopeptide (TPR) repeat protein
MHLNLGNLAAAESSLRDAMARSLALVEADSSNMFWLSESCFYRLKLAEIEVAQGARDAARLDVEHAIKDIEKLLASDASALNWQINLRGLALAQRTAIAQLEGRDPPQREIEALLSDVQGFESAGRVLSAAQATIVAGLELASGDVLDAAGQHDAARDHWRAAAIRLQTRTGDANYPALTLRARALTRLGERTQAQALFARIQASNYRHPAYAALAHELVQEAGPRTQGELEWPTPLSRSRTISFRSNRRSSTPDRETTAGTAMSPLATSASRAIKSGLRPWPSPRLTRRAGRQVSGTALSSPLGGRNKRPLSLIVCSGLALKEAWKNLFQQDFPSSLTVRLSPLPATCRAAPRPTVVNYFPQLVSSTSPSLSAL